MIITGIFHSPFLLNFVLTFPRETAIITGMRNKIRKQPLYGFFFLIIYLMGMTMNSEQPPVSNFLKKLPAEVNGWRQSTEHRVYTEDDLHEYINGGAELYISYGFKDILSLHYYKGEGEERMEIKVDIFDMTHSFNAFGVFTHGSEIHDYPLGQGAEYAAGMLACWKDRYYFSILAYPETEEKKEVVLHLGKKITEAIPSEGPLPPVIQRLPQENLVPHSKRYFFHYIWLNSYYYLSDDNVLFIREDTPAAMARYGTGIKGKNLMVLVVEYPEQSRAEAAVDNFRRQIMPYASDGLKQLKDGRWLGCKRKEKLAIIIINAPDREAFDGFVEKIK